MKKSLVFKRAWNEHKTKVLLLTYKLIKQKDYDYGNKNAKQY